MDLGNSSAPIGRRLSSMTTVVVPFFYTWVKRNDVGGFPIMFAADSSPVVSLCLTLMARGV